jgi:hypothetical protein
MCQNNLANFFLLVETILDIKSSLLTSQGQAAIVSSNFLFHLWYIEDWIECFPAYLDRLTPLDIFHGDP